MPKWYFLLLGLVLLLLGCEEKTFSRVYDKRAQKSHISALSLAISSPKIKEIVKAALEKESIKIEQGSRYTLEVESSRYAHHCNNPQSASYDATYDGYVKITLLRQLHPLYMVQRDYHGKLNANLVASLIQKLQEDMEIEFTH